MIPMSTNHKSETSHAAEIRSLLEDGRAVDPELKQIFSDEAEDHLRTIYDSLDRLRIDPADTAALSDIRRATHTLKGAAGAVGVMSASRLSHRMEDLLDDLSISGRPLTSEILDLILSATDRLQEITAACFDVDAMVVSIEQIYQQFEFLLPDANGSMPPQLDSSESIDGFECEISFDDESDQRDPELKAALDAFGISMDEFDQCQIPEDPAESDEQPTRPTSSTDGDRGQPTETHLRVPLARIDQLVRLVGEMVIQRGTFAKRLGDFAAQINDMQTALDRIRKASEEVETRCSNESFRTPVRESMASRTVDFAANHRIDSPGRPSMQRDQEFDELEFDRYNDLHFLAKTLEEATSDVASVTRECRALSGDFDWLMRRWQRLTREAQDRLTQIRMVPLRTVVPTLGRVVRSTASQCGKLVQFVVRGDHTELDKTVLEEISGPLLHLVRNAVAHGIETPRQRSERGKTDAATLSIEVVNQGTQITIRVEDDGRGLDVDRIRQRAVERGLIDDDVELSPDAIEELIFRPGFSTAETVTDVSGRGVGLDVVRETVERLRGTIGLDNTAEAGVCFTITLPATLAVTRAVLVQCGEASFAVPMKSISQIVRGELDQIRVVDGKPVIQVNDRSIPVRSLADLLGIAPSSEIAPLISMLILESGDRRLAVAVDEIETGQDIVVKSLGDHLRNVPGVIGATLSGDGSVVPILDPGNLIQRHHVMPLSQEVQCSDADAPRIGDRQRYVLVVDDSVSVRRVTASVMRNGGWFVATAKDGIDALEQLDGQSRTPDVILLDMEMPRMDGLEFLAHLRSSTQHANTPVIMITSRSGDKHRSRAIEAGASEYVVKPFRDDHLLATASRLADGVAASV